MFCYRPGVVLALAEAMGLAVRNRSDNLGTPDSYQGLEEACCCSAIADNRLALACIPGAGHMFLGLIKQGAQLMAGFFLILVLADWLNVSV